MADKKIKKKKNSKKKEGKTWEKWTDEQIKEALAIAENTSFPHAAKVTGIPYGTLRNRAKRMGKLDTSDQQAYKNLKEKSEEKAVEKASEHMADQLMKLSDELYKAAFDALKQTQEMVINKDKKNDKWLKALVSVWHNAIQDGQLLSNRPTSRPEVSNKHEYHITQKLVSDPDLARELQRTLAERADNNDAFATAGRMVERDNG